ncbi:hypothetical protein A2454_05865 [Candidatus Peribacteria bacterium RIFOXYC2_FULL_55_14]|nr:MAG: hypothetical protein UY87_C0067G0005 [Candidatus Peribacteria bacterium GW2011_GWC2_54_8]KKW40088.1 MAG: hypothetical protein UY90_C0089G0004 [Candidatus Peregrinibacteria bacterium GW2011_GWA2_54_9]OGJ72651.1 MAG: hypothetical protein A2217_04885 [Candidatus Peribacteria bacterium RIFOXYA2_FULL_55_28]OGJ73534.1 MAG: hypothetical protein A2384_03640 [Candidatus Peribacteria bacterium RIFOXYB1_FULL_54_35]OGJ76036.1 MAG: hypothetical protein A2327_05420 [Candidatus Peribacteria bacterium 
MTQQAKREFGQLFQSYLTNVVLFLFAILIYRKSFYYSGFLGPEVQDALLWIVGLYIVLAIPLEMLLPRGQRRLVGKGLIALRATMRFLSEGWRYIRRAPLDASNPPVMKKEEKVAILFLLVKFYFLPVMMQLFVGNFHSITYYWRLFGGTTDIHDFMLRVMFPFTISLFYFVDTSYFVFGYSVEYPLARNKVRSVEPTLFGWLVTLICYSPFYEVSAKYLFWSSDTSGYLSSLTATYAMRIASIVFLAIYLWATLALGTKCSNLTNRGIVTSGPYAYIRHPAYFFKALGWWVAAIPYIVTTDNFLLATLSLGGWTVIYFFRALTEEWHLLQDPDYQEYCKVVRWRFIPYVL